MQRRAVLSSLAAGFAPAAWAQTAADGRPVRIGAAWRGPAADDPQQVGVIEVDWSAATVRVRHALTMPSRAHGFVAEPDGALLAVALRPGTWLVRIDVEGRLVRRVTPDDDGGGTTYDGHVAASADGTRLYTTETRKADGGGCIGVRDARTLRKLDEWSTHGIEPHQLLLDSQGHLVVANGGIHRGPGDRKIDLDHMDASLVRLHGTSGALLGQWRLPDARLSIRHMAWSAATGVRAPLLGLALQAEHADPALRKQAPTLAVWDGEQLTVPTHHAGAIGYAGDIAPAADGGFVITSHNVGRALLWRPQQPAELTVVAQLQQAYALTAWHDARAPGGVLIAAARGIGRWHPTRAPALLPWPQPMALDNHWVAWA